MNLLIIVLLVSTFSFLFFWWNTEIHLEKERNKYPWPIAFHTVDVALYREVFALDKKTIIGYEVCMGQKPNEVGTELWRFPGGFVDPLLDKSAEDAARRECLEEVKNVEIDKTPIYITSMMTNDYRYRESRNKIITSFYKIKYIYGHPVAGDDLAEVCWLSINELSLEKVNPIHKELFENLIKTVCS